MSIQPYCIRAYYASAIEAVYSFFALKHEKYVIHYGTTNYEEKYQQ